METPTPQQRTLSLQRPLMAGEDVRQLQVMLALLVNPDLQIDGLFGPRTEDALRKYQAASAALTADGVCGPETWASLHALMARRPKEFSAEPSVFKRAAAAIGKFLGR